ncbi:racemase [Candidatus Sumerlaeota bacterium]|nr:racemase [Candidatus Sumerlaeota bacterium]
MKITDIKCYVTESTAKPPRYRWRDGHLPDGPGVAPGEKFHTAILKVETDEGLVGMTQSKGGRGYATAEVVRRRLKPLIGQDPLLTERLWFLVWEIDRIERFQLHVLGMLDECLWDIKSRKAAMPLYQMLGGNTRRVRAYASTTTFETMDEYERRIKECMDVGFTAFKLHGWGRLKEDSALCRNLRKWTGDDATLMYDGSAAFDYVEAMKLGRVLEEADFYWFEEPMRELDLFSYKKLCDALDIPICAAETCEGCHWNASTWIRLGALDMMRTSRHEKGGITGATKVAHLAESCGMRVQVHGMGLANLHLCAAFPNTDFYEQLVWSSEQIADLKNQGPLAIVDGLMNAPDTPGIEPHPDWKKLEKEAVMIV